MHGEIETLVGQPVPEKFAVLAGPAADACRRPDKDLPRETNPICGWPNEF